MSLFSWLFSPKVPRLAGRELGLSGLEPTRPAGKRADGAKAGSPNAPPANRKSERMAQRELLYSVVRESMVRAGVLSSSYKFKVLSLDSRGRQFMVMVDLAADHAGSTAQLAEIEALIAQSAKSRYDIVGHRRVLAPQRARGGRRPAARGRAPGLIAARGAAIRSRRRSSQGRAAADPASVAAGGDARRPNGTELTTRSCRPKSRRSSGRSPPARPVPPRRLPCPARRRNGGCSARARKGPAPSVRRFGQARPAKLHAADRIRGHRSSRTRASPP